MAAVTVEMNNHSGRTCQAPAARLSPSIARVGFWTAWSAAALAVVWTVAALLMALNSPTSSWQGIDAYAASFDGRQMLMLVPVLLLAPTFVVVMACIHAYAADDAKPWALLGVAFATMYATISSVTYVLQLTVVRQHLLSHETAGLDLLVSVNPGSVARATETFGYVFMSLALLAAAPVFGGGRSERWIRYLFLANGLGLPATAVYIYTMDVLHPIALASLVVWCVSFPVAMGLLAALFRTTPDARLGVAVRAGARDEPERSVLGVRRS
jgi:hypothetical protein